MPDIEQAIPCTYQPLPGEVLKTACPDCGHAALLHIGVEHCPVCELVQHTGRCAPRWQPTASRCT